MAIDLTFEKGKYLKKSQVRFAYELRWAILIEDNYELSQAVLIEDNYDLSWAVLIEDNYEST